MPFIWWVIRAFRTFGPAAARWTLRNFAAGYLASLAIAATKPHEEQEVFRDTLRETSKYPSALRRIFFDVLRSAIEEAVWTAFVSYARQIRETDPELKDAADDVIAA
jgi:hypothetical protein